MVLDGCECNVQPAEVVSWVIPVSAASAQELVAIWTLKLVAPPAAVSRKASDSSSDGVPLQVDLAGRDVDGAHPPDLQRVQPGEV